MTDSSIHSDGRMHGVIVGCQRDDERWLLIRRGWKVAAAPGKVCFPGGTVEIGESQQNAVVREMREELGVDVEPVQRVWQSFYEDKPLLLSAWLGILLSHEFKADEVEVAQVLWLTAQEAANYPDTLPHHQEIVAAMVAAIAK